MGLTTERVQGAGCQPGASGTGSTTQRHSGPSGKALEMQGEIRRRSQAFHTDCTGDDKSVFTEEKKMMLRPRALSSNPLDSAKNKAWYKGRLSLPCFLSFYQAE